MLYLKQRNVQLARGAFIILISQLTLDNSNSLSVIESNFASMTWTANIVGANKISSIRGVDMLIFLKLVGGIRLEIK